MLQYKEAWPLSVVVAFLRMGEKYAIRIFSDEAKEILSRSIEPTFSTARTTPDLTLLPRITGGDPYNFQIMNLLQEHGLTAPLPLAMYRCIITCPLTVIVHGYEFNDSVYSLSPANMRYFILMKDLLDQCRVELAQHLRESASCTRWSCWYDVSRL